MPESTVTVTSKEEGEGSDDTNPNNDLSSIPHGANADVDPELNGMHRWSEYLSAHTTTGSSVGFVTSGAGLQLAGSRAKQLTRCNRRAVLQILETSQILEAFAQDLLRASSPLNAISNSLVATKATVGKGSTAAAVDSASGVKDVSLQQLTASTVRTYYKMAQCIKTSAGHLERFLNTHDEAITNLCERHLSSRRLAERARQKALTARNVYVDVHKDVLSALKDWNREQGSKEGSESVQSAPHTKMTMPARILSKLSQLQNCESRYKRMVTEENESVKQCRRLEAMALESMQMLQEDRYLIAVHSWIKLLASANSKIVTDQTIEPTQEFQPSVLDSPMKKPDTRAIRKSSLSGLILTVDEEEGAGSMDAETLGLPIEIGQLRDQVLRLASARVRAVHSARVLDSFLDSIAVAAAKLGQELKLQQLNGFGSVGETMKSVNECERAMQLWSGVASSLAKQSHASLHFSEQLKSLKNVSFDHIIEYGEKDLKPLIERDNATWKQMCDAARSQAKAEARYQAAIAHKIKAKDRCMSVDNDSSGGASLANVAGKHVSQSLANMFSILPNGGDHAMKVLDPAMRASLAHANFEDADHKESKERQLLDSAMELTGLSLDAYKSSAESFLLHCDQKVEGHDDIIASISLHLQEFHTSRQQSVEIIGKSVSNASYEGLPLYINGCAETLLDGIQIDRDGSAADTPVIPESMLTVSLENSDVIQNALRSLDTHPEIPVPSDIANDDETETEAYDNVLECLTSTPIRERAASASAVTAKIPADESATSWILRSLTMPDTESIFGKLALTKKIPRLQHLDLSVDTETSIFTRFFWPDELDCKGINLVMDSFACSFRDGGQRFPFQYGRVFVTNSQLLFIGWTRKQLSLSWTSVVGLKQMQNQLSGQHDVIIVKCCKNGSTEESFMVLSGFVNRQAAFDLIEKETEKRKSTNSVLKSVPSDGTKTLPTIPFSGPVVADETLPKMVRIVTGRLRSLTIQDYYNIVWSERNDSNNAPFYKPWLEKECFEVDIGQWQTDNIVGPWCKEKYSQKREVRFKVKRKTHLYIGPPIANALQVRALNKMCSSLFSF